MSTYSVPQWVIGRQITNLSIAPCTISGSTVTPGSAVILTGVLESIMLRNQPEEVEISPMDATETNTVILKDSVTMEMTELLQNSTPASGTPNALALFMSPTAAAYNYAVFTISRGSGSPHTWSFLGQRSTFSDGGDKGVWKTTLTVKMVGIAPTYT